MERSEYPPEFQSIADWIDSQPPHLRALFRYALVMMLVDTERARVVGSHRENGRLFLHVETGENRVFNVLKPELTESEEQELRDGVWKLFEEEQGED